ncbi:MAG: hypothetical protein HY912_07145 [Desulfomonile tiedjei]|uniref:Uncharacterized protein n=1 Tax=Desulfomonile tiedjei TaxID=2358 RepID=A0A9D6YZV0_9BACT|nr:hypothetical protein [Desulfomonile tiedjei]
MKAICTFVILITVVAVQFAFGQQAQPMYDPAYAGPMNVYGQPTFGDASQRVPANQQQQQANGGLIPMAFNGLYGVGSYFWSYMPAPVRGVESPYAVPPGSGQVITNFVPGTR